MCECENKCCYQNNNDFIIFLSCYWNYLLFCMVDWWWKPEYPEQTADHQQKTCKQNKTLLFSNLYFKIHAHFNMNRTSTQQFYLFLGDVERNCGICTTKKIGNFKIRLYADFSKNHHFETNVKGSAYMQSG